MIQNVDPNSKSNRKMLKILKNTVRIIFVCVSVTTNNCIHRCLSICFVNVAYRDNKLMKYGTLNFQKTPLIDSNPFILILPGQHKSV